MLTIPLLDLSCGLVYPVRGFCDCGGYGAAVFGRFRVSVVCAVHVRQAQVWVGEQSFGVYCHWTRCSGAVFAVGVWGEVEDEE